MRNRIIEDLEEAMPVSCPRCGDIWDLEDMRQSDDPFNKVLVCPDCYYEEKKEFEKQYKIDGILLDMENGVIGKREGKKQLKELGYKFPKP